MRLLQSCLHLRIFGAEETIGRFVLLDGREASLQHRIKAVVIGIIIALGNFTQQNVAGARLHLEIVVEILLDENGLTRGKTNLGAGGNGIGTAVGVDSDVGFVVDRLIGIGIVDPDQNVAATTIDDVLGLVPVEMVGGILALFQVQELLSINLGVLVLHLLMAVANGDQGEAHLLEITHAIVGNVPAQAAIPDFVILMALGFPLFRSEMAEWRQIAVILLANSFQFLQSLVNFRTLHSYRSFADFLCNFDTNVPFPQTLVKPLGIKCDIYLAITGFHSGM